ncbi:L,D-transpeptidase family protein [Micromonospora sp. NPDC126480]|uniref:L,D-transpeptidase family protein n=1 Tax=Micromonospora sp. NPDC126480 TaxID=3155312 RepID=UPI0033204863
MFTFRFATRLLALVVVTLVGTGACAFEPGSEGGVGGGAAPAGAAEQPTGASGTPGPDRSAPASPKPKPTPTRSGPTAKPEPSRSAPKPSSSPSPAGCPQGERQRQVETYLTRLGGFGKLTVDGRQSAADCAAIKRFQQRYDIRPAHGRAGPLTYAVAKRLATTDTDVCGRRSGLTFCVDLTRQTTWVMRDGKVIVKPTVTRTGMAGFRTPAGTFTIDRRNRKEWSNPYEVWLPYWQHFTRGMGFHETTTYLHDYSLGSHGCVNLLHADAIRYWELGRIGSRVVLVGSRSG